MVEAPYNVYILKQLELVIRPRFLEICASADMTAPQYTALTVLKRRPGVTSSELARRSFVRAQTMATTLEPLLDAGLVRRESDPTNARRKLLYITDAGVEAIARLAGPIEDLERVITDGFTTEERTQFSELLRRSRSNLAAAQLPSGTDEGEPRRHRARSSRTALPASARPAEGGVATEPFDGLRTPTA